MTLCPQTRPPLLSVPVLQEVIADVTRKLELLSPATNKAQQSLPVSPKQLDTHHLGIAPITVLNQQEVVGGYDEKFVDQLPKSLECPICKLALREPQVIDCSCSSHYCTTCLQQLIQHGANKCPVCTEAFNSRVANNRIKREVEGMKVYCRRQQYGCEWIGELRHLQHHLKMECQCVSGTGEV